MTALAVPDSGTRWNVGMGQIAVGRDGDTLEAVLGSCVGVVVLNRQRRIAALAHVVLPATCGRQGLPGKCADTAIPEILRLLEEAGAGTLGLVAKLVGGANMFDRAGVMQIGEANIAAVQNLLAQHRVRVVGSALRGNKGRRISVDCHTGLVDVDVVGCEKIVL
jgi:chemotaxis protein CheD